MFQRRLDYIMGRSDDAMSTAASSKMLALLAVSQVEDDLTGYALKYARLDAYGRKAVEAVIRAEYNRCRSENTLTTPTAYFGNISVCRETADEQTEHRPIQAWMPEWVGVYISCGGVDIGATENVMLPSAITNSLLR